MITNKNILSLKKILIILNFIIPSVFAQQNELHSTQNIKLFADFLFCDKDYLRAIKEYEKYLTTLNNDTVEFKVAYCFSQIGEYEYAMEKFSSINISSPFHDLSLLEKLKIHYLLNDTATFFKEAKDAIRSSTVSQNVIKFKNSFTLLVNELPEKISFISAFNENEKPLIEKFYDQKKNPNYKSEITAGILSAIIPGAGKIYTQNYGDGVTAFLLTGLFAYLAYDNFKHDHQTRAWIFTAFGVGFYVGNIYGSVASAQIFNAKVNFDFSQGVKLFIENNNYFIPPYEFCN